MTGQPYSDSDDLSNAGGDVCLYHGILLQLMIFHLPCDNAQFQLNSIP